MPDIGDLAECLRARRPRRGVFVIGVTGGVAAGKSTLSAELKRAIAAWPGSPSVEVACTDGFLRPNAELDAARLAARKGFPETYDLAALRDALIQVRRGAARFPGYSHLVYDVDPRLARLIDRSDVLVAEGLGFTAATPVDTLVYIDADERDLEAWFTARFLGLWRRGLTDATSFYARFAHLNEAAAKALAAAVWAGINLPNIRRNVLPLRDLADIVVRKGADHGVESITESKIPRPAG